MRARCAGQHPGVHLTLSLTLPRDEMTVPVARHVVRSSMREVGVHANCVSDIEIALTEACTNVLKHSGPGDKYDVSLSLDPTVATLRVIDTGRGFDFGSLDGLDADHDDEQGRGVSLIQALVDQVKFTSIPEEGTIVHLEKELEFDESSPFSELLRRAGGG
jgi:serine/threonine-protein kinase RsbW